jgi:hypothetical protein
MCCSFNLEEIKIKLSIITDAKTNKVLFIIKTIDHSLFNYYF